MIVHRQAFHRFELLFRMGRPREREMAAKASDVDRRLV